VFGSNAPKFAKLFSRAENLFERLRDILKEWESKVVLGLIDMEKMIEENVKTAHDWEINFRSSKSWGQQIAKLNWSDLYLTVLQISNVHFQISYAFFNYSAELNVECFIVSTAAVRLELETHNRRYWDAMSASLYSSILFDMANINKFIEESVDILRRNYSSAKQANSNHLKIVDESHEVILSY